MVSRRVSPGIRGCRALTLALAVSVLLQLLASTVDAQRSNRTSPWQTLKGNPPIVIARGGFSGLLQDSSSAAYSLALMTSVPDVVLWCDVQLTKDAIGICFPDVKLDNASNIADVYKNRSHSYQVNGVPTSGWFALDFTLKELGKVSLTQGIYSRTNSFDGNGYQIMKVEDVATQLQPPGFWLNLQHSSFYAQHNLSMTNFVLSVTKQVAANYISSPDVKFLQSIAGRFKSNLTKLVFRFMDKDSIEPLTNLTYGSLLSNLNFVKTFASGILVPKSYIWPVDTSMYLLPHTSLVNNAHKQGVEVYASGFANDFLLPYNYSYDPITEYLSFIDNGEFSVDGVLSDFPITSSESIDCFAHLGKKAQDQVDVLVITKDGASGDYPGCTDLAYQKAITDGADIIDCPVQMSKDGTPFCLSSIDLGNSTTVAQSPFNNLSSAIPELGAVAGTYSFSLTWPEIQSLNPSIENPFTIYSLFRNPKYKNSGHLISLAEFLDLSKNATSLSGVLISVENAAYLAEKQGLDVVDAVLTALTKSSYNNQTTKKVLISSTDDSVLTKFKNERNYELVYKIKENIRDIQSPAAEDIKKFAHSVVIGKKSVFPDKEDFITGSTDVVLKLQKLKLPVYVEVFNNEFVSQAWDFFSDPTVEINSYVEGAGINGVITDFPKTSARYKRNRCLGRGKNTPSYMKPVQPGGLFQLISPPFMPPAEAPNPVFTASDITEPPLPPVTVTAESPAPVAGSATTASTPPPNGQTRVVSCLILSVLGILLSSLLTL